MNKKFLLAIAPLAALLATPASAQQCAGHCSKCQAAGGVKHMYTFEESYHMNAMWPQQYVAPARRGYCQAFELQIANGWRRNNLLGKYDFAHDGSGLSEAGKLRVAWILAQAPPHRRTIFVEQGADQAETAGRVEAVQTLAATVNPSLGIVDVQETHIRGYGRPAAGVDAMFTEFQTGQVEDYPPTLQAPGIHQNTGLGTGQ